MESEKERQKRVYTKLLEMTNAIANRKKTE